jgi:hypothetical protein
MTEGLRGCKDHRRRGITEAELLTRDYGRGGIPVMPGSKAPMLGSRSFQESRRGVCEGRGGLGCGGAAQPR